MRFSATRPACDIILTFMAFSIHARASVVVDMSRLGWLVMDIDVHS